jgi:tetratricopeptide (TPR) repeat protein
MKSSPRRLLLRDFALCSLAGLPCWLFPATAYAATEPGKAVPPAASPPAIVFYIATGGPNSCGHGCNQWIAADGTIDESAAQRLRQLLRKLAGRKLPVFFHSPGGNASAAMEVGRLLRKEKLAASVGRTAPDGCDRDKLYDEPCKGLKHDGVMAELNDTVTMCNSACVYVLAGAFERLVPPGAHLGIHSVHIQPRTPMSAAIIAVARKQTDQRIDAYLREMGVDRALLAEADAIPYQSVRFLRRDEIVRFGMDRREFGETGWHFTDKPRPTISKAYFMRSGNKEFPYRTAFLRMDCGAAKLAPLMVGIEMAADETGAGPGPFVITVNGTRLENGWGPEYLVREPARFDLRATNLPADMMAGMDDGGSIEIFTPNPNIGAQSTVRLAMNGFSGAYATLRKACDAAHSVSAGCPGGGTPPHCLILPPPGQTTWPLLPSLPTQPWSQRKGDPDRAIAALDEAIRLDPKDASAYANRAAADLRKGDYDRAIADLDEAIRLNPTYATAYGIRGNAYVGKDDYDRAIADFDEAIRLDPKDANAYGHRGNAYYFGKRDWDHAIADFDEVIRLDPKSAAYNNRGLAYSSKGDYDHAIADFDEVIRLDPKSFNAYVSRGEAYAAKNDPDHAIADFNQALKLYPSLPAAQRGLERAQVLLAKRSNSGVQANTPFGTAVAVAPSGRRIALVIGMSAYANVAPLHNPVSDARAVADALRRLGFAEVIEREDLTRPKLEEALKDFGDNAADADWAVIYYAGHGVEMNGENYLVPVDAKLDSADRVEDETVTLKRVLSKAEAAHKLRMVILDACRDNPFRMASADGRTRAISRGVSPVEPAGGVLVAYVACHGTTADDDSNHSPLTQALLANLETPGLEIKFMFRRVRDQVLARTNNAQEPFIYGSLPQEELYFKQAAAR